MEILSLCLFASTFRHEILLVVRRLLQTGLARGYLGLLRWQFAIENDGCLSFLLSRLHLRASLLRVPSAAKDHGDSTEDEREHLGHRRANVGDEEHHQRDAECTVEYRGNLALRRLRGDMSIAWWGRRQINSDCPGLVLPIVETSVTA